MSDYWKICLRSREDGQRVFLCSSSSERAARELVSTLNAETGCDRFYVEREGSDYDGGAISM